MTKEEFMQKIDFYEKEFQEIFTPEIRTSKKYNKMNINTEDLMEDEKAVVIQSKKLREMFSSIQSSQEIFREYKLNCLEKELEKLKKIIKNIQW